MSDYDRKQHQPDNDGSSTNSITDSTTKTIEENYQRFNELINQNLANENNLEKELAATDKKCTFLRHKILYIQKQLAEVEQISLNQEKRVHTQRMEIEKICSAIVEQTEKLKIKFPEEGLAYYSNMVTVISNMIEYVGNFKLKLNEISTECDHIDTEINLQKDSVTQIVERIYKMIDQRNALHMKREELLQLCTSYDFNDMNQNFVILNDKFNEYSKLRNNVITANVNKEHLTRIEKECVDKFRKIKENTSVMTKKYDIIVKFYGAKFSELRRDGISIENEYYKMVMELNVLFNNILEQMKTLKSRLFYDKKQCETFTAQEFEFRNEYQEISSQVELLCAEYSKINTLMNSFKEQEPFSTEIRDALQKQIDTNEQTKKILEAELKTRTQEMQLMKTNYDTYSSKSEDPIQDYEKLIYITNQEQEKIRNIQSDNHELENSVEELKQVIKKLSLDEHEKLKNDLTIRYAERNFLQATLKNMQEELDDVIAKGIEKINQKLNDTMENVEELSNSIFEKQLIIDNLQRDIRERTKEYILMQYKVWSTNQEYEIKKVELEKFDQEIVKEQEAYENKKKLLQDLEKNTFPRNKIPVNWFKSFEKQKKEYELLAKERLEFEKQRNKLIIEIDSQGFQKNKSEMTVGDASKVHSNEAVKTTMYDMFKERISKKDSSM